MYQYPQSKGYYPYHKMDILVYVVVPYFKTAFLLRPQFFEAQQTPQSVFFL